MATGIPFLGSKISLISKSEIRYEGILYTIDTKESTVALAKVRSYGTEDRPTDRPVAPRDETYEYIIFRGADIKDIRVCQPPKPRPTLEGGLPNDPAIVQHSRGPPGDPIQVTGHSTTAATSGHVVEHSSSKQSVSYGPIGSSTAASAGQNAAESVRSQKNAGSPVMDLLREGQSGTSSPTGGGAQSGGRPGSRTSGSGAYDNRRGRGGGGPHRAARGGNRGTNSTGAGSFFRGGVGQVGHRGRGGFQPGRPSSSKKETLKFDREYDFEQANEEFKEFLEKFEKTGLESVESDKVEVQNDAGDGEGGDHSAGRVSKSPNEVGNGEVVPSCYDKTKSFFDSISCEASERQRGSGGRPDWKAEKKLNRETFGVTGGGGRRNYYHGGGYGRGGRGYGGGYRGGYGHSYGGGFDNNRGYGFHSGGNRYIGRGGRGGWRYNGQSGGGRGRGRGGAWRTTEA